MKQRDQDEIKFNVGDRVRLKLNEPDDSGKLWSDEIYTIEKINKPKSRVSSVYYQLKNDNKHYYNNDLQLIGEVKNTIEQDELFKIGKLIKPLFNDDNEPCYLVKWKGYSN